MRHSTFVLVKNPLALVHFCVKAPGILLLGATSIHTDLFWPRISFTITAHETKSLTSCAHTAEGEDSAIRKGLHFTIPGGLQIETAVRRGSITTTFAPCLLPGLHSFSVALLFG